jgi:hypothetical protein
MTKFPCPHATVEPNIPRLFGAVPPPFNDTSGKAGGKYRKSRKMPKVFQYLRSVTG